MMKYLIEVGLENVVQNCIENASLKNHIEGLATLVLLGMYGSCVETPFVGLRC
jgi:hypothetical protein